MVFYDKPGEPVLANSETGEVDSSDDFFPRDTAHSAQQTNRLSPDQLTVGHACQPEAAGVTERDQQTSPRASRKQTESRATPSTNSDAGFPFPSGSARPAPIDTSVRNNAQRRAPTKQGVAILTTPPTTAAAPVIAGTAQAALNMPSPSAFVLTPAHRTARGRTQNGTTGSTRPGYGALIQDFVPVNVQLPVNIEIGVIEISTFFPNWLQIPAAIMRVLRNGWDRNTLAKAQLHAWGELDKENHRIASMRIQQQVSLGGKLWSGNMSDRWKTAAFVSQNGPQNDLTAGTWQLRCEYDDGKGAHPGRMRFAHAKLADIRAPVPESQPPHVGH